MTLLEHGKRAETIRKKLQANTSEIIATQKEMATWPFFRDVTIGELTWDNKEKIIRFQGGTPLLQCDYETLIRHNKEMPTFREFAIKTLEKEFADPIDDKVEVHVLTETQEAVAERIATAKGSSHGKK